ncbi:MAG: MATE family efflux transporter [Eubacteriales bacterium]|nr:MATE family efflux transporter [Eubacteriales bacterium]
MCNEISYLIIIGIVNALGVTASAGVGIAEKLVIFILLIPMSYMQSISAFVAQNAGAGQYGRDYGLHFVLSWRRHIHDIPKRRSCGRCRGSHERLCRVPQSNLHRMLYFIRCLLPHRIF